MRIVVGNIFDRYVSRKVFSAKNVAVRNIIGYKPNGSGNVLNVISEPPYAAGQ